MRWRRSICRVGLAGAALLLAAFTAEAWAQSTRPQTGRRPTEVAKEGDKAPDFRLKTLDGKREVHLQSYAGKKPVALIFGSYT